MPSYKVIQSGHIVEIYRYQCGISKRMDDEFKSRSGGRDKEGIEERKEEYSGRVNQNARNKIRRLINANFNGGSEFITLTYDPKLNGGEIFSDLEQGSKDLKQFVQRMKRRQSDFKYVAVVEFTKKGQIHYHMMCNYKIDWIKGRENKKERQSHEGILSKVWRHGFADIGYKDNDNAGAYLIKYMTKDNNDSRLKGKQRYFFSRKLDQPKELTGLEAVRVIREFEGLPPVFTNEYYSEFHGSVQYLEYNPKRYDYNEFKRGIEEAENKMVNMAIELFGDVVEVR